MGRKQYLGDAVYVNFDGYGLVLTTEDGIRATNRIVLEPEVYAALVAYVDALRSDTVKGPSEIPSSPDGAARALAGDEGAEDD